MPGLSSCKRSPTPIGRSTCSSWALSEAVPGKESCSSCRASGLISRANFGTLCTVSSGVTRSLLPKLRNKVRADRCISDSRTAFAEHYNHHNKVICLLFRRMQQSTAEKIRCSCLAGHSLVPATYSPLSIVLYDSALVFLKNSRCLGSGYFPRSSVGQYRGPQNHLYMGRPPRQGFLDQHLVVSSGTA